MLGTIDPLCSVDESPAPLVRHRLGADPGLEQWPSPPPLRLFAGSRRHEALPRRSRACRSAMRRHRRCPPHRRLHRRLQYNKSLVSGVPNARQGTWRRQHARQVRAARPRQPDLERVLGRHPRPGLARRAAISSPRSQRCLLVAGHPQPVRWLKRRAKRSCGRPGPRARRQNRRVLETTRSAMPRCLLKATRRRMHDRDRRPQVPLSSRRPCCRGIWTSARCRTVFRKLRWL